MVTAYWKIGRLIFEACGENDRAAYGKQVLNYISERFAPDFGKDYNIRDLRLQKFLLERGCGFSFLARQKHFNVDGRHFYNDLVFCNYILKCFVLIDLKTGVTHQDIGQMQMYVNYFTRYMMNEGDNPPVGLPLCTQKSDTLVRLTLPEDNRQIYATKHMPYLTTEEELKRG